MGNRAVLEHKGMELKKPCANAQGYNKKSYQIPQELFEEHEINGSNET